MKPDDFTFITEHNHTVTCSDKKEDGELLDSWTKFRFNNKINVNGKFGGITGLVNFRNILMFTQNDAYGILSVEDRELQQSSNIGGFVLGTGGVLTRFDYVATNIGVKESIANGKVNLIPTAQSLYMYDSDRRKLFRYSGEHEVLSDKMGQSVTYVDTTIDPNYPTYVQQDEDSTNPEITVFMQTTAKEPLYPKVPGYKIVGNTIWVNTNQDTVVRLAYRRFPIWDDLTPKIPDDPKVIRMCADFIAFQHATKLWVHGEINRDVFSWVETQYYHSVGAARNKARIASLGKMEELKNKYKITKKNKLSAKELSTIAKYEEAIKRNKQKPSSQKGSSSA